MIKVAIIGVMAALLVIPLKREKGEIGLLVILAACLLILSLSLDRIREILDGVRTMKNLLGKGSVYIGILLKMIGITYVAGIFLKSLCGCRVSCCCRSDRVLWKDHDHGSKSANLIDLSGHNRNYLRKGKQWNRLTSFLGKYPAMRSSQ